MPKKTRKQKLASDRRHLREDKPHSHPVDRSVTSQATASESGLYSFVSTRTTTSVRSVTPQESARLAAIKIDLLKTLILAAVAVGIEFFLYWRLR